VYNDLSNKERYMKALIVVDMQNDYYIGGAMELVGIERAHTRTVELIELMKSRGDKVIFVQHLASEDASFFKEGSYGGEFYDELPVQKDDEIVRKRYPNSFRDTNLKELLDSDDISQLVVCGAMTHMCIDTTVRAAYDLGYSVELVGDACVTKDLEYDGVVIDADMVQRSFLAALDGIFCDVLNVSKSQDGIILEKDN